MIRRPLLLGVLSVLVACTSCAVAPEERAHVIPGEEVPYDLLDAAASGTTSTAPDGAALSIFLVRDDELVEVRRQLPSDALPLEVLRSLATGPTEAEAAADLAISVLDPQVFASVEVVRGTAQVDLDASFSDLDAEAQALAIAQTVMTLTGRPGIGRVGFSLDGSSVEVPRGDGALTGEPLARDDFAALVSSAPG